MCPLSPLDFGESPSPSGGEGLRLSRRHVPCPGAAVFTRFGALVEDLVDDAERLRLVGFQERVAIHRLLDVFDLLAGILGVERVEALAHAEDLARLNLDVR